MKLIKSRYWETSGLSECIVIHKGKDYYGWAFLHPEDKEANLGSKYTGCRYAEIRAEIKALKDEYKIEKKACDECRKFVKACIQYKNFDKESPTAKAIFTQLNKRIKRVNKIVDKINQKIQDLDTAIKQKEIVSNALARKKSKKDN
jgi:antitoxin component HigA of HigAB toxin-antitoxin module